MDIHKGCPFLWSKWRDSKRNLNRRGTPLERALRSFRLIRSPSFACGDAPLGRRSARSPPAFTRPRLRVPAIVNMKTGISARDIPVFMSKWRDSNPRPFGPEPNALPNCATPRGGADEGTRTPDLLITNRLLYQLSHIGTTSNAYYNKAAIFCPAFFSALKKRS